MLIGFGLVVVLPITAILTSHQRKMAELMARRPQMDQQNQADQTRIARLESEVYELKQTLQGHIIATDQIMMGRDVRQNPTFTEAQPQRPTPPLPEDVRAKLG